MVDDRKVSIQVEQYSVKNFSRNHHCYLLPPFYNIYIYILIWRIKMGKKKEKKEDVENGRKSDEISRKRIGFEETD